MSDDSDDALVAIGEVLPGQRLHRLERGWTPVDTYVLVKCLDEEGQVRWSYRSSPAVNLEELLGALTVQVERLRTRLVQSWCDGS